MRYIPIAAVALLSVAFAQAQPSNELSQAYSMCVGKKLTEGSDGTDPKNYPAGYYADSCPEIVKRMAAAKEQQSKNRPAQIENQEKKQFDELTKKLGVK